MRGQVGQPLDRAHRIGQEVELAAHVGQDGDLGHRAGHGRHSRVDVREHDDRVDHVGHIGHLARQRVHGVGHEPEPGHRVGQVVHLGRQVGQDPDLAHHVGDVRELAAHVRQRHNLRNGAGQRGQDGRQVGQRHNLVEVVGQVGQLPGHVGDRLVDAPDVAHEQRHVGGHAIDIAVDIRDGQVHEVHIGKQARQVRRHPVDVLVDIGDRRRHIGDGELHPGKLSAHRAHAAGDVIQLPGRDLHRDAVRGPAGAGIGAQHLVIPGRPARGGGGELEDAARKLAHEQRAEHRAADGVEDRHHGSRAGAGPVEDAQGGSGLDRTGPGQDAGRPLVDFGRQLGKLARQVGSARADHADGVGQCGKLREGVCTESGEVGSDTCGFKADLRRHIAQRGQPVGHVLPHPRDSRTDGAHVAVHTGYVLIDVRDARQHDIPRRIDGRDRRLRGRQEREGDPGSVNDPGELDFHLGKVGTALVQRRRHVDPVGTVVPRGRCHHCPLQVAFRVIDVDRTFGRARHDLAAPLQPRHRLEDVVGRVVGEVRHHAVFRRGFRLAHGHVDRPGGLGAPVENDLVEEVLAGPHRVERAERIVVDNVRSGGQAGGRPARAVGDAQVGEPVGRIGLVVDLPRDRVVVDRKGGVAVVIRAGHVGREHGCVPGILDADPGNRAFHVGHGPEVLAELVIALARDRRGVGLHPVVGPPHQVGAVVEVERRGVAPGEPLDDGRLQGIELFAAVGRLDGQFRHQVEGAGRVGDVGRVGVRHPDLGGPELGRVVRGPRQAEHAIGQDRGTQDLDRGREIVHGIFHVEGSRHVAGLGPHDGIGIRDLPVLAGCRGDDLDRRLRHNAEERRVGFHAVQVPDADRQVRAHRRRRDHPVVVGAGPVVGNRQHDRSGHDQVNGVRAGGADGDPFDPVGFANGPDVGAGGLGDLDAAQREQLGHPVVGRRHSLDLDPRGGRRLPG